MNSNTKSLDEELRTSFLDQLNFTLQDFPIILYSKHHGYNYSISTRKFRPFNSVIWYHIYGQDCQDALYFLEELCNSLIDCKIANGKIPYKQGTTIDGFVEINLDSLKVDDNIKESYNNLIAFLDQKYRLNEAYLLRIIDKIKK